MQCSVCSCVGHLKCYLYILPFIGDNGIYAQGRIQIFLERCGASAKRGGTKGFFGAKNLAVKKFELVVKVEDSPQNSIGSVHNCYILIPVWIGA